MRPSHTAHRQHRYSSFHVTMICYINRMAAFSQTRISFPSEEHTWAFAFAVPSRQKTKADNSSSTRLGLCSRGSAVLQILTSNHSCIQILKNKIELIMCFRTLTPNYFFPMDSSVVNLNPPVHSLIWNTFHEPLRSSVQLATVKKLGAKKQSKIWDCRGALLHPWDSEVETTLQRTGKALQNTYGILFIFNETWRLRDMKANADWGCKTFCTRHRSARNTCCLINL